LASAQNLDQYTAIFIGGGNTFKLLKEIKDSKFDQKLQEYLNHGGLVYGSSAGAVIFGKSIKPCEYGEYGDINHVGLTDLSGLNLAGGKDIFCHYTNGVNDIIKNYPIDSYILYDESGLLIEDHKIKAVGKPFLCKADIA
jgi:dipeptidase E